MVAYSGSQAIDIACRERPSHVLLVIGLPGLDGYQVASRLRGELAGSIIMIAITGYGREVDRQRAPAAGFDHHFVKPLDHGGLNTLLSALNTGPNGREAAPDAGAVPMADAETAGSPSFPMGGGQA